MKKQISILLFILCVGCAQERIPKPSPFLTAKQMINFHVDLAIVNAASKYEKDSVVPLDSLYVYHGIDSITFALNNTFYAAKPKEYKKIFEEVKMILKNMEQVDTLPKIIQPPIVQ